MFKVQGLRSKMVFGFDIIWSIIVLACAIWVIYDVFANQKKMVTWEKVTWTIFAILFSVIVAIVYYFKYKR